MTDVTVDPGADPTTSPEVQDYVRRLETAGRSLPPERLAEVLADVRDHVRQAVAAEVAAGGDAAAAARNALARLGTPEEIARAEAEQSGVPVAVAAAGPPQPGGLVRYGEPVAIFLLMFGGFLLVVGWFAGVVLLWLSPSWRLREKLLGTFVWPFGYLGVLGVGSTASYVEQCVSTSTAVGDPTRTCTGGAPYPVWIGALVAVVVLVAPILVAMALWRRRQAVLEGRAT